MANKRPRQSSPLFLWALVVIIAAILAWGFFKTSRPQPESSATNPAPAFDTTKATNLLRWVETNKIVSVPVPTSAPPVIRSNVVVIPKSNPPPIIPTFTITNPVVTVPKPLPPGIERPVKTVLEAQIALARLAISSGPIDGVAGFQTQAAIRAFQKEKELPETGALDTATKNELLIVEPVFTTYLVTPIDLQQIALLPETWLGKSQAPSLAYETILEMVAEKHLASQPLIRSLNPSINWTNIVAMTSVKVPHVPRRSTKEKAAFVRIQLAAKTLEAFGMETNLLAHFPCSIAARVEKRPAGTLFVVTAAENPNYTFDPEVFPESEEAQQLGRKLIIPPGPNNPVGTAWISLDKPGYGIHGTPRPEQVGRTESHGCFRLANWNAEHLLKIVWAGMPVYVEP